MKSRRVGLVTVICAGCLVGTALTPLFGTIPIGVGDFWGGTLTDIQRQVFFDIRLPRVILAFFVGATLAQAGLVLQSLLRNPLVSEFTLGVASGASLGSAIFFQFGMSWAALSLSGSVWLAFAGAMATTVLVYGIAMSLRRRDAVTLLLAGVAVSFFLSSAILFLQYAADFTALARIIRWVMGGIGVVGYREVVTLLPFTLICAAIFTWFSPELNIIGAGDDIAHARGVNVRAIRRGLFLAVSIAVGAAVSLCGPIGFVGLMAPHFARLIFGADNRTLAPVTFFIGGAFLAVCDSIARTVFSPAELPVGIITALLGAPFFIWLLIQRRRNSVF